MKRRAVLAVAGVLMLSACTESDRTAIGSTDDRPIREASDNDTSPATNGSDSVRSTTTTEAKETEADLIVDAGLTSAMSIIDTRHTSVGALITNPNSTYAAYDATVVFNLLGPDGSILDTESVNVPYIPADSTVPVAPYFLGFDAPTEPTSVDVEIVGSFERDRGWDGVGFSMDEGIDLEVSGAAIIPGSYSTSLTFNATNPSDRVAEWGSWSCVFRNGGVIVGGASSSISDPIVPGGTVRVDSSLSVDDIAADEIICRAYF